MRRLPGGLVAAALVLIPSLLFLGRYAIDGTGNAPVGSDTPQHVWRSAVVARLGLEALPAVDGEAHALHTNADRPGLPLVMAALGSVTGAEPRDLVYVLPAVLAAAIATAAAALAGSIAGVPWWGAALAGIATGASAQVAFTANGYLDQLLVEPLVLAAGAGALTAAAGRRGRVLAAACLAAAFLVHWQFAAMFAGLLLLLALACLPESFRNNRPGSFVDSPAGRVGTILAAGAGLGVAGLLAGASGMPRLPTEFARGTTADRGQARSYRLPATVVAAVAGLVSLFVPDGGSGRRRAGWLLGAWALLPAGAALLYAAGRTVPVQRTLSFALAIPLLGALGVVAAVGWLRARGGKVAVAVAAVLAVVALLASMSFGWDVWRSRRPWSEGRRLAELHTAAAYLAGTGDPAVVVVDTGGTSGSSGEFGTIPVLRRIRAELPPTQALHTTVYLGDPDLLLEGRPTLRPDVPGFDRDLPRYLARGQAAPASGPRRRDPAVALRRVRRGGRVASRLVVERLDGGGPGAARAGAAPSGAPASEPGSAPRVVGVVPRRDLARRRGLGGSVRQRLALPPYGSRTGRRRGRARRRRRSSRSASGSGWADPGV